MEQIDSDVPLGSNGKINVAVIYNLKNEKETHNHGCIDEQAEYDCETTVLAIRKALTEAGYGVSLLEADEKLPEKLRINRDKIDIAFNIAEGCGGRGREAQVPAILDLYGIPYTGSDETTLCIALDKALTKRLLSTYKIKTPGYTVASPDAPLKLAGLHFPLIVKPVAEGSSKGISDVSIAANRHELDSLLKHDFQLYNCPMLIEEYIEGREFTVGMLGNGLSRRIFTPMEIKYKKPTQDSYHVYSFGVKQKFREFVDYACPADISPVTEKTMTDYTAKICDVLGCRDFTRADFRIAADGTVYFIEVNPLPGLAPEYSDFPMLAGYSGMSYNSVVCSVLESALARLRM